MRRKIKGQRGLVFAKCKKDFLLYFFNHNDTKFYH